jgi:hypothetical protein
LREAGVDAGKLSNFTKLVVQPMVLMISDTRRGMPVLRAGLLGLCLGMSAMLMGVRAGTFKCLVPQVSMAAVEPAVQHSSSGPRGGEVLFPEEPSKKNVVVEVAEPLVKQPAEQRADNISAPSPASISARVTQSLPPPPPPEDQ